MKTGQLRISNDSLTLYVGRNIPHSGETFPKGTLLLLLQNHRKYPVYANSPIEWWTTLVDGQRLWVKSIDLRDMTKIFSL